MGPSAELIMLKRKFLYRDTGKPLLWFFIQYAKERGDT